MNRIKEALADAMLNSRKASKQRQFGLMLTIAALALFTFSIYENGWLLSTSQLIFIVLAVIFVTITFIFCKGYFPFLLVWLIIGNILGLITSFFILIIIYYGIISPVSLAMRLFGNNKQKDAGWNEKNNVIDYKKLF